MARYIMKFGGSSVASIDHIRAAAEVVAQRWREGHDVAVVLSAMGDTTDELLNKALAISSRPYPRELDMLLSAGEQVSVSLMAMALREQGIKARSLLGHQVRIKTDGVHCKARIEEVETVRLEAELAERNIPVVAGFQGLSPAGEVTTLGRGGSDTTAVALAAALDADECQILTDVDGVYTTDPRVVPQARRLARVTFEEMLELASLGSRVLQIRSVQFAGKYNVPVRVLHNSGEGEGTLISYEEPDVEAPVVSGIAFSRDEAQVTITGVPDRPGVGYAILSRVSESHIVVDMIVMNAPRSGIVDFSFSVPRDEYEQAMELTRVAATEVGAGDVLGSPNVAKISVVGVGMRSHAGVATTMFEVLAREGINVRMVSTSEIKISVLIEEKYLELGVRSLHEAFGLDREPGATGTVG
jgi:aspartate kinase